MFPDQFGLPPGSMIDAQVFQAGPSFQQWNKPRGISMVLLIAIGSGSGGGGGMTGLTATIRGGGGGGASGAIARCLIPARFLPDTLYASVGLGGAGGAATVNGSAGVRSYVSIQPNITAANIVLQSGAAAATGGTAGSVAGSAAGGAAETISTDALSLWGATGFTKYLAGKIGAAGGAVGGAAGSNNTILTTHFLNGGAGGGTTPAANTNFAGGNQTGASIFFSITGGAAGSATPGSAGVLLENPFLSYGGVGGGTVQGLAGVGSDAALGSGGGGGGGGTTGAAGGRGGNGLVMIYSW